MIMTSFIRFLIVSSLSLFIGLTIQQRSVSAATSTVGITFSDIMPEAQPKSDQEEAAKAEIQAAWLAVDFTDDSPVEVEETINGQTQHYLEYADGTSSQTTRPVETEEVTTTTKKGLPKKEKFKPMPSIATIKQLTFDWTSAQVMQPLEKMIANTIKAL